MERWGEKAIKEALEDFLTIKSIVQEKENFQKTFRARAREIPSLISVNFLPTLTFCYSQTNGKYGQIADVIEKKTPPNNIGELEFAYGSFLYLMLKRLGLNPRDPLRSFKDMIEASPFKIVVMKRKLLQYLLELKEFAEAEFRSVEE